MADNPLVDNPTNGDIRVAANELADTSFAQAIQLLASDATATDSRVPASTTDGLRVEIQNRTTSTSGSFTAAAQTVAFDVTTMAGLVVQVGGTYGTVNITFEALADNGSTWVLIAGVRSDSAIVETASGNLTNTNRAWEFDVSGYTDFRVRCTARTSGTMTVVINASAATSAPFIVAQLAAGSAAIGSTTVTSLVPGVAATSLGKAEDAVAASGDTGVAVWAVRRDTPTTDASAAGDYHALHVDALGSLRVIAREDEFQITATSAGLTTATTAYTAGDMVGTIFTFANATSVSGGYGEVISASLTDATKVLSICDLILFSATSSPAADNAANAWADGDALLREGIINFPGFIDSANNRFLEATNLGVRYKCAATSLFGCLVTRTGHTFFGTASDIQIKLNVRRN